MARSSDIGNLVLLGVVAYVAYQWYQSSAAQAAGGTGTSVQCKFPDGSTIAMPAGNSCPYDASHGGQSTPCYPASFVGPVPQGGAHC